MSSTRPSDTTTLTPEKPIADQFVNLACEIFHWRGTDSEEKLLKEKYFQNIHIFKLANAAKGIKAEEIKQKFYALLDALINAEKTNLTDKHYQIVINFFHREAQAILKAEKSKHPRSLKSIRASYQELDAQLYGKPPLGSELKAVICGIVGALVGAVLGGVVFAAVTSWNGGFGALPGAIYGMTKGFTLGGSLCMASESSAFTLGLIGGAYGFFTGEGNQDRYAKQRLEKMSSINPRILAALKM